MKNLSFRWPSQTEDTLKIDALSVQPKEHIFIKGASGSGKSTLLSLIAGINLVSQGELNVLGKSLSEMSSFQRDQFRANHLGIIFQQFNLLSYLSVQDNITLPSWFSRKRGQAINEKQAMVQLLLEKLDLPKKIATQPVSELSTGQQQRVAVARALIGSPEIIIADEPTSSLDTDNRDRFLQLLFEQADTNNSSLVFVSHDSAIASHFDKQIDLASINHADHEFGRGAL
ncbi:MAG: ABC transporter ATP-binding protein [Arenicella sp.]